MATIDWTQRSLSSTYVSFREDGGYDTVVDGVIVYRSPADPEQLRVITEAQRASRTLAHGKPEANG